MPGCVTELFAAESTNRELEATKHSLLFKFSSTFAIRFAAVADAATFPETVRGGGAKPGQGDDG